MSCCIVLTLLTGTQLLSISIRRVRKHHPISVAFFVRPSATPVAGRRGYTLSISMYSIVRRAEHHATQPVDAGRLGRDGSSRSRRAAY